jgi:hypothetical protein
MRHLILAGLLLLSGCSAAGRLASDTPRGIDLSGTWRLNRSASDDPRKIMERLRNRREPAPPRSADGTYDPDDGSAKDDRGRGPDNRSSGRDARERGVPGDFLVDVAQGRGLLRIEQRPTVLVIEYGVRVRRFTPGGSSVVSVASGVADQRAGWNGGEFVIETSGRDRPTIVERFSLSADRSQLVVDVKISGSGHMPSLNLKRVYDSATASDEEAGPNT